MTAFRNRRSLALQQIFLWIFLNWWLGELMKPPPPLLLAAGTFYLGKKSPLALGFLEGFFNLRFKFELNWYLTRVHVFSGCA